MSVFVFIGAIISLFSELSHRAQYRTETHAEQLRHSEEQQRITLASIADGVIVTDCEGRITLINAVAQQLTGWSAEEAVGQPLNRVFAIFHEGTDQARENLVARVLQGGQAVQLQTPTELFAKDGTRKPIDDNAAPLRDADGVMNGVVLVFRDITERRRLERQRDASTRHHQAARAEAEAARRLFQRMAEATPDILYRYDLLEKRLVYVNRSLSQVLGYTAEHFLSLSEADFGALIHPDDRAVLGKIVAQRPELGDEEVLEFEYRIRHADGTYRWLRSRDTIFTRTPDQQPQQLLGLAQDITRHKQAAEDLREADRRKDEFLAMLGHELRNPLAPIRNALQILRASHAADPDVRRLTTMMERQITNMVRLVEDLLDVSRISRGKIELRRKPVDLIELVQHTVETLRPLFEERQHRLETEWPAEPLILKADAARIEQVLTNLLTNAVKYTPPEGLICLKLRREVDEVVLAVSDNGIGIRPEMLPRIFDMFQQADRLPGRVAEGLGLGLTLVRTLIEMHDGHVQVWSEGPGCGSEFVVRLPWSPLEVPVELSSLAPMPTAGAEPAQVLVVDDNLDGAETLAMVLRMAGHNVEIANDGPEALAAAQAHPPEIVLLDIGLPNGMDGYEVARRLRTHCGLEHVLLVAVTGYGQEEDRLRAREAGFDAHLTKPVDFEDLNELLTEAVKVSHIRSA